MELYYEDEDDEGKSNDGITCENQPKMNINNHLYDKLCVMCHKSIANIVFLDCSHILYCSTCFNKNDNYKICEFCYSGIRQIIKIDFTKWYYLFIIE